MGFCVREPALIDSVNQIQAGSYYPMTRLRSLLRNFYCLVPVMVLFLAGCAHFESQPISSTKLATDFDARSLDNPELRDFLRRNLKSDTFEWPPKSWDLTNLVLAGLYYHPDLDLARAHWAVVRAGKKTAAERPNPTLSLAPAYNTSTPVPTPWLLVASLDIPIETAGKRGYRIAQATQLSEAARLNIDSVAWSVRSRIRQAMVDLYAAGEMESLLKEQQALQVENLRLMDNQQKAGAISTFELTQARIAADGTKLALRDAERQSAEARVQLADSIGISAKALEGISLSFAGLLDLPMEIPSTDARRQAMLGRADIRGALAEYEASQSALQLEIAKQYPDIHIGPGYEFDQGDSKWSLGPSVTLPVLSRNKGPIAEAQARRTEAAANVMAIQARVAGDIDRALAGYKVAIQKKADTDALREHLLKQEKAAQAMLDAGEISRADLATQRLQLSAAAVARLDALSKSLQAYGLLEDAWQNPTGVPATAWETSGRLSKVAKTTPHP